MEPGPMGTWRRPKGPARFGASPRMGEGGVAMLVRRLAARLDTRLGVLVTAVVWVASFLLGAEDVLAGRHHP